MRTCEPSDGVRTASIPVGASGSSTTSCDHWRRGDETASTGPADPIVSVPSVAPPRKLTDTRTPRAPTGTPAGPVSRTSRVAGLVVGPDRPTRAAESTTRTGSGSMVIVVPPGVGPEENQALR